MTYPHPSIRKSPDGSDPTLLFFFALRFLFRRSGSEPSGDETIIEVLQIFSSGLGAAKRREPKKFYGYDGSLTGDNLSVQDKNDDALSKYLTGDNLRYSQ